MERHKSFYRQNFIIWRNGREIENIGLQHTHPSYFTAERKPHM